MEADHRQNVILMHNINKYILYLCETILSSLESGYNLGDILEKVLIC